MNFGRFMVGTLFCLAAHATANEPSTGAGVPPAYKGDLPSLAALNVRNARLDVILDDLDRPRAFEFLGPRALLITEIHGRLLHVDLDTRVQTAVNGVPEFVSKHPQTGLLDVALHPDFDRNRQIYFTYVEADALTGNYFTPVLARAVLGDGELRQVETLLRVEPHGWSPANFGGVIAFDDSGHLFLTIGDRSEDPIAQRGDRLEGKLLRLRDDGGIPADNPFVQDAEIDDRIYAIGLRNAQGLVFDAASGRLLEAEHGPLGGDEINIMVPGGNYGWPLASYGRNYSTARIGEGTHSPGTLQPLFYYLPSEAISPLTIYRGDMFGEWDGHLLAGALKGAHVSKLDLQGDRIVSRSTMLGELNARVRDIKVHEDGAIWVLLQDGRLVRLYREGAEPTPALGGDPADIYRYMCSGCHDMAANGAPPLEDTAHWRHLANEPRSDLYQRVIDGFGAMPARGLCNLCTDDQLRDTVDYMMERDRPSENSTRANE
jgi:glucose/arabinose dehydrogenase